MRTWDDAAALWLVEKKWPASSFNVSENWNDLRILGASDSLAWGTSLAMVAIASSTRYRVRPVIITRAPAADRPLAMESPMPAVEPVTIAVLLLRSICMGIYSKHSISLVWARHERAALMRINRQDPDSPDWPMPSIKRRVS